MNNKITSKGELRDMNELNAAPFVANEKAQALDPTLKARQTQVQIPAGQKSEGQNK